MAVVAFTSAAPNPKVAQVDKFIDLTVTPLPIAAVQLYGDLTETGDPGPVGTFAWTILEKPAGSLVHFQDTGTDNSTLQNPILAGVDTWENIVVFLVATNTNTGHVSEADYYAAELTARVHVRVEGQSLGLEKPAYLELNWKARYHAAIEALETLAAGGGGGGGGPQIDNVRVMPPGSLTTLGFTNLIVPQTPIPGSTFPQPHVLLPLDDSFTIEEYSVSFVDGGDGASDYGFRLYMGTLGDWHAGTPVSVPGTDLIIPTVGNKPTEGSIVPLAGFAGAPYIGLVCMACPEMPGTGMTLTIRLSK